MRPVRLCLLVALVLSLVVPTSAAVASSEPTGHTCGDGTDAGTHAYDEPRVFVDAQGWWTATDPATRDDLNDSGHVHVGACIPAWQRVPAGPWELRVRLVLHDHAGVFDKLNVTTKGWGYEWDPMNLAADQLYLDPNFTQPAPAGAWYGQRGASQVRWARVVIDSSTDFDRTGLQEVRFRAFTRHDGEMFAATMTFQVDVPDRVGVKHSDYTREPNLRAKGVYGDRHAPDPEDDRAYCEASMLPSALPTGPVSGTWDVPVVLADHKTGNNDSPVTHHHVRLDFNAHMGMPGVEVLDGPGDWPADNPTEQLTTSPIFGVVPIDTTALSDGWHSLSVKADCQDVVLASGGASTQGGHLVIRFEVDNGTGTGGGETGGDGGTAPALPEHQLIGSGDADGTSWTCHRVDLAALGPATATLSWTHGGDLNLFVRRPGERDSMAWANGTGPSPEVVAFDVDVAGPWRFCVKTKSGAGPYQLAVDTA